MLLPIMLVHYAHIMLTFKEHSQILRVVTSVSRSELLSSLSCELECGVPITTDLLLTHRRCV